MDSGIALQEFLEYTISKLVSAPQNASISHEILEGKHIYRIRIASQDVGKVIGRNGYTISAIRSLVKAAASRNRLSVGIKVYSVDGENEGEQVA